MSRRSPIASALLFCLLLMIAMPAVLMAWGVVLPYYAQVVGGFSRGILAGVLGYPIEAVRIEASGILNTQTRMVFLWEGREPALDFGALAFNVPPFVALMGLSPGLPWRRRLRGLGAGTAILAAGHVVYVVLALVFAPEIARSPQIPTALGELFLSLPFLLWIMFGYWDRLAALMRPAQESNRLASKPEKGAPQDESGGATR